MLPRSLIGHIPALSGKASQESMLSFSENLQSKFSEYLSMVKGSITSVAEAGGQNAQTHGANH